MPLPGAIVLGLGWLVRPELLVFSVIFLVVLLAMQWQAGWRNRALLVVAFAAVPFVYQVFRMGYYGSLVATTAIAKEGTRVRWDRGWNYLRDFSGPYWLWVPGLVIALAAYLPLLTALHHRRERRAEWVVVAFVVGSVLDALYVIAVGGDYMHGRLFLPALFAVCAPVALLPATRRYLASLAIAPWIVASAFFLRPPELDRDRVVAGTGFVLTKDWGKVSLAERGWGPDSHKRGGTRDSPTTTK